VYWVFGHQQGAWKSTGSRRAEVTWLHFRIDPNEPLPQGYGRVDAEMEFESDCESMDGTLDLRMYGFLEDPLDRTDGVLWVPDLGFTGRRINP
jgi:hypothetical protein